jgi:CBS-domain-containing membrane protein
MKDFFRVRYAQQHTNFLVLASVATFATIYLLGYLADSSGLHLLIAPFGATCIIVFGFYGLPIAKYENVVGAYFIAIVLGFIVPYTLWGVSLAVALTLFAMIKANYIHPPAGGIPLLIHYSQPQMSEFVLSTTMGVLAIILISIPFRLIVDKVILKKKVE